MLFATIRFHDTVSRGRLLNRFGQDFEGAVDARVASVGAFSESFLWQVLTAACRTTLAAVSCLGCPRS